jgi:hypothetical protein
MSKLKTSDEIVNERLKNRQPISPGKETEIKDNGMTLSEAAKKHMIERFIGGSKFTRKSKASAYDYKDTTCIMCGRNMTVSKKENPPHYCYLCHDEAEGVFGRG